MQTIEFTNITKHNTPYLYPYELSITIFNHYVELGILNITDKQYFNIINE